MDLFNKNTFIQPGFSFDDIPVDSINDILPDILSKFSYDYIMDVIKYSLSIKFRPYDGSMPNIVYGLEYNFNQLLTTPGIDIQKVQDTRLEVYSNVISILSDHYDLDYHSREDVDIYQAAFVLYNLLVSDYTNSIIRFFTNMIIKETPMIINSMFKDSYQDVVKNPSFVYSKKMFKDERYAIVHNKLPEIIANLSNMDIDLYGVLDNIYPDKDLVNYILMLISDNGNFYKNHFVKNISDPKDGPEIITQIRLALQISAQYLEIV